MGLISIFIDRGCLLLFFATVLSILSKHFRLEPGDPYNCGALLTQGNWLDVPKSSSAAPMYNDWSPSTCMMHKYTAKDLRECLGGRKVVLIGDSQVRQIFWVIAAKLDRQLAENEFRKADQHSDQSFHGFGNLELEYIWDPYLNSTELSRELTAASLEVNGAGSENSSSIVLVGGGLWFVKNLGDQSSEQFSASLKNIAHTLGVYQNASSELGNSPQMLPQIDPAGSLTMLVPMQRPLYESLDLEHAKTLTPARFEPLHQILMDMSSQYEIPILWAYDQMTNKSNTYQSDGLHFTENVVTAIADLIFNAKCNTFLTAVNGYPMDKTCCGKYPQLKKTQFMLINAAWIFPSVAWLLPWVLRTTSAFFKDMIPQEDQFWKQVNRSSKRLHGLLETMPPPKVSRAIVVFLLTLCYCWLADRTHLYDKAQKHYDDRDFRMLCLLTFMIGVLSIRRSKGANREKSSRSDAATDDYFLSRDQTDEWKGWMQIIVLIYHYTGASKVLWIYKIIRLLVAAYLFQTGYGHTVFFCTRSDYSLKRAAGVLIRLNMLSCILPYIMQTDYLFYYFAPLVSFWYIVVYATMAIGKSWNKILPLLTVKILISATCVTSIISCQLGVFESAFSILKKLCNIHWDAGDWQFRLGLDKYIVFVGMLVAACTVANPGKGSVLASDPKETERPYKSKVPDTLSRQFILETMNHRVGASRLLYFTVTCGGCLFYALFAYPSTDKENHNSIFSIASIGPILAFIAIRNAFSWTRRFHSSIFAWIGRYSLETFVLQFHIWLAADTKGVLSTGLFNRSQRKGKWLDFVLLTTLFLWVCWHATDALHTLTAYVLEPNVARKGGHYSSKGLPVTKNDGHSEAKSPKKEIETLREDSARYIAGRLGHAVRLPTTVIAESLWARLVLIMCIFWCLNVFK